MFYIGWGFLMFNRLMFACMQRGSLKIGGHAQILKTAINNIKNSYSYKLIKSKFIWEELINLC